MSPRLLVLLRSLLAFVLLLFPLTYLHHYLFIYYANIPTTSLQNTPITKQNITILTIFHQQTPLFKASLENHESYAKIHGYIYKPVTFDYMKDVQDKGRKSYNKIAHLIRVVMEVMESGGEWIL
jgi:hypothetical protein